MKRLLLMTALLLIGFFAEAQMNASWYQRKGKGVCAAYNYGQFTGETGKRHKYVPRGKKHVRGRSYSAMHHFARKNAQRRIRLFNPHR
jgi:hypothetical protein